LKQHRRKRNRQRVEWLTRRWIAAAPGFLSFARSLVHSTWGGRVIALAHKVHQRHEGHERSKTK
jgi:hypothetical protein